MTDAEITDFGRAFTAFTEAQSDLEAARTRGNRAAVEAATDRVLEAAAAYAAALERQAQAVREAAFSFLIARHRADAEEVAAAEVRLALEVGGDARTPQV